MAWSCQSRGQRVQRGGMVRKSASVCPLSHSSVSRSPAVRIELGIRESMTGSCGMVREVHVSPVMLPVAVCRLRQWAGSCLCQSPRCLGGTQSRGEPKSLTAHGSGDGCSAGSGACAGRRVEATGGTPARWGGSSSRLWGRGRKR